MYQVNNKTKEIELIRGDIYIGDTEPTDEGINVWIDTSSDKSSPIVGVRQVGYMKI